MRSFRTATPSVRRSSWAAWRWRSSADRKSTRLNSSHTEIYTLSLHDALPISRVAVIGAAVVDALFPNSNPVGQKIKLGRMEMEIIGRSEEHTSELQSHRDLHSFPTRRSSDLSCSGDWRRGGRCALSEQQPRRSEDQAGPHGDGDHR